MVADAGGTNRFAHSIPQRFVADGVVNHWYSGTGSPDLAYSVCPLDLRRGPQRLQIAQLTDYWSFVIYAMNSDPVCVLAGERGSKVAQHLIVGGGKGKEKANGDVPEVKVPGSRALVVVRMLVTSEAAAREVEVAQERMRCSPFRGTV